MERKETVLKYTVVALMISTAAIYFAVASEESNEIGQVREEVGDESVGIGGRQVEAAAAVDGSNNGAGDRSNAAVPAVDDEDPSSAIAESALFVTAGMAYVAVAGWMLVDLSKAAKTKNEVVKGGRQNSPDGNNPGNTRVPYVIAIAGSASLIILYIISRTVALPIVGLQEDVGPIDVTSKILQAGIIGVSISILLLESRRSRVWGHLIR